MTTDLNVNELMGGDRRQFYRVVPSVEEPIVLKIGDGSFPLVEISGGGCSLPIAAHSKLADAGSLDLCLPGRSSTISVRLQVVNIGAKAFGAMFVGLDKEVREVICDYVRSREIELARRFRAQTYSAC